MTNDQHQQCTEQETALRLQPGADVHQARLEYLMLMLRMARNVEQQA